MMRSSWSSGWGPGAGQGEGPPPPARGGRGGPGKGAMKWPKRSEREGGREVCGYTHRICLQNRLEGFDYCIRHILVEKSAPFKQCSFIHPQSGKRCPNAARRTERRDSTLCPWHIKKLYLKRKQAQQQQQQMKQSAAESEQNNRTLQGLMKELEHFCPELGHDKKRTNEDWVKQEDDTTTASEELRQRIVESAANANDSDTEDEANNPLLEESLRSDIMDSDSESIDSDHEDPLKHAGVYTAEEVSLILSDKMHRLQYLYIEQFKHLKYLLKEKYKKYSQAFLHEKDISRGEGSATGSMSSFGPDYARLRALMRYHRYQGDEALLKRQAKEKRRAATDCSNQSSQHLTCIFAKEDDICQNRALPLSHYCIKHVLYDVNQVLFRPCASGNPPCLHPIVSYSHNNTCISHTDLKADKAQLRKLMGREDDSAQVGTSTAEPEQFQTIDDVASLALDAVAAGSLFGLDQFGDLGSSDLLHTNL